MPNLESDFDEFRDDFVLYLAARLGVSEDAAVGYLGDWLMAFAADPSRPLRGTTAKMACEEQDSVLPATNGADSERSRT